MASLRVLVHAFHLPIRPWMIDLGKPVFDIILVAETIKNMCPYPFILFAVGKLDAIVSEDGVDRIGHGGNEVT